MNSLLVLVKHESKGDADPPWGWHPWVVVVQGIAGSFRKEKDAFKLE